MMFLNSMSFTYEFDYDEDIVFFSYFQPYTMSDLKDFLYSLTKNLPADFLKNNLRIQKLCNSIEGNACHLLTITENILTDGALTPLPPNGSLPLAPNGKEPKQVIIFTGRIHPGESNASYMIQGCIEYLLQP